MIVGRWSFSNSSTWATRTILKASGRSLGGCCGGISGFGFGSWPGGRRQLLGDAWSQIHGGLVVVVIMGNILRIWNL